MLTSVLSIFPQIHAVDFLADFGRRKQNQSSAMLAVLAITLCGASGVGWSQTKTATTTTLAVTSSSSAVTTVAAGSVVTLTASVQTGSTGVTTGQVNFCDASATYCTDIHLLGTAQLTSAGTAVLKFRPGSGSHSYMAIFAGTNAYAGSLSSASSLTVTGKYPTLTTIAASGSPGDYTLTATVGSADNEPDVAAPTGTVSFLDTSFGNAVITTATLGTGTTGLGFLNSQAPGTGYDPWSIVTGDFNDDGIPDLAVANYSDGTVTILLGNGDGTFTQATNSPLALGNTTFFVATGDFNRDGKADLAVLSGYYGGTVTIFLGNGDGTFAKAAGNPIALGGAFGINDAAAIGDFNGDGILDLAVATDEDVYGPSTVTILLGNGDGTFTVANGGPVTVGEDPNSIVMGDFNGDGIPDFATANFPADSVSIFLGNGDGTFAQATNSPITVGSFPYAISAADFNKDGKIDLAVANSAYTSGAAGTVTILLGNGNGMFTQATDSPVTVGGTPQSVSVGDFNGDGIPDLAVANNADDTVTILLGSGTGAFTPAVNGPAATGDFPQSIAVADFTGSGISDLAVGNENDSVTVLLSEFETATATVNGIAPVGAGTHNVEASYAGDSNYSTSTSATVALAAGVAPPVISPAAGAITSAQPITITDSTPGATIYYELSGAVYTNGYVQYTGPIPTEGSGALIIQAYATETGYQQSEYASATYTLNFPSAAATPVITPAPGLYASAQTVTISDSTPGATIYYTTNGVYPWTNSSAYSGPITVSTSEVITAVALAPGYAGSGYAAAQYDIASSSTRFIYTIAGNITYGYSGDGGPATFAEVGNLASVAVDSKGNVYVADNAYNVVRKIAAGTGIITTVAGTGMAGHTGDSGPAASAELWAPYALAVDAAGDLFIGEIGDNVVRRVDATTGTITTFAGNPSGTGSIGGPAASFKLYGIDGLACDSLGNLDIAEGGDVVQVNASTGNISEIAGYSTDAGFGYLDGIAVDSGRNIYVSDTDSSVVDKITPQGVVSVFAGSPNGTYIANGGDGGPATAARLYYPAGLAVDGAGNVYIADYFDDAIRQVNTNGIINTIAGIFGDPYSSGGDGSPATDVGIFYPQAIAADAAGNIYFADTTEGRVRKITVPTTPPTATTAAPVFSLAAGTYSNSQTLTMTDATPGAEIYVSLNGSVPNTSAQGYHGPIEISGNVTAQAIALAPGYQPSAPVSAAYSVTAPPAALITTVAGSGSTEFAAVNGPALSAMIGSPQAVAFDSAGNLYIASQLNNVVWMVAAQTGIASIVAGTGTQGNSGDGGQATEADLNEPSGVAVDSAGNLYISDTGNGRIRMVAAQTGIITTVAGPGIGGTPGDGGPATSAYIAFTYGIALDSAGDLYIAEESSTGSVRRIDAKTQIITTVAGGGTEGQLGDGGLATAAYLSYPMDVALDSAGNLYILDNNNARIRKVTASTDVITTIAGNGIWGTTGDGGRATAAEIDLVQGIAVDGVGNVYFSNWPDTLRKVDAASGVISTIAGISYFGYSGDGGPATAAELYEPKGMAFDASGSLYVADFSNSRVREVIFTASAVPPAITLTPSAASITTAQSVTVTVAVSGEGTNPIPTGSVTLSGGGYSSAATTLSNGAAAIVILAGALEQGKDTLKVTYSPDIASAAEYKSATQSTSVAVTAPPTITLTPSAASITTAQPVTVTVAVSGGGTNPIPTGSVTLSGGGYSSAATTLNKGGAAIAIPAGALEQGIDALSVTYSPNNASASEYTSATQSTSIAVTAPPTITLTPSATSITTAQPLTMTVAVTGGGANPVPTGSVTLSGGGFNSAATTLSNGGAAIVILAGALEQGKDTLKVTYSPDTASATEYTSATQSTSVTVSVPIGTAAATVTATPSATDITNNQSETVSVSVAGGSGQAAPTGTVTLTSGSYSAQKTLANGTASFDIPAGTLNSGTDTLTASFAGDATYAAANGTAIVTVSQVVMAISTPSPVSPGASATAKVTVTAGGNYSGTLDMKCALTSSPAGAQSLPTCSLNPASVAISAGGSGVTTLTVNTTAASSSAFAHPDRQNLWRLGGEGTVLAVVLLFGLPSRRRRWMTMFLLLGLIAVAGAIGCGGGGGTSGSGGGSTGSTTPATTAGAYTFSVTGTDSANANVKVSANVTVTVQ